MSRNLTVPMSYLKRRMLDISKQLWQAGYRDEAAELKGAANILQTWIDGIGEDRRKENENK